MATTCSGGLARRGLRLLTPANGSSLRSTSRQSLVTANLTTPRNHIVSTVRPFSHSSSLQKSRKLAAPSNSPTWNQPKRTPSSARSKQPSSSSDEPPLDTEDPPDISALEAAFAPIDAHFKSELHAVLHGGHFSVVSLGALPVPVKSDEVPPVTSTFPLRELAQVVPRSGRSISLLLNDRAYVKPVMSAIQASPDFNQQPQRAEDNDLELLLKVELERRPVALRRVKETCTAWRERVRQARAGHDKAFKEWRRSREQRPDVARKADQKIQMAQDKKMKEIAEEEARTVKQLGRRDES